MNNKHLSWNKEINNNFIIASRAYFLHAKRELEMQEATEIEEHREEELRVA